MTARAVRAAWAIFTYPPSKVLDVMQAEHLDIAVESESSMFR